MSQDTPPVGEDLESPVENLKEVVKDIDILLGEIDNSLGGEDTSDEQKKQLKSDKKELEDIKRDIESAIKEYEETGGSPGQGQSDTGDIKPTDGSGGQADSGNRKPTGTGIEGDDMSNKCFKGYFTSKKSKLFAKSTTSIELIRSFNSMAGRIAASAAIKTDLDFGDVKSKVAGGIHIKAFESFGNKVNSKGKTLLGLSGNQNKQYFSVVDGKILLNKSSSSLFDEKASGVYIIDDQNAGNFYRKYISPIITSLEDKDSFNLGSCGLGDLKQDEVPGFVLSQALNSRGIKSNSSRPLEDSLVFLLTIYYIISILEVGDYSVLQPGT